jgi:hypothetical protein
MEAVDILNATKGFFEPGEMLYISTDEVNRPPMCCAN